MLDTIFGVPTHALVVHAVVVLLPLAAIGGVAVALVPALRRRYGELVVLAAIGAAAAVPVATHSGQYLFNRKSATFGPGSATEAGLMEQHRHLAHQLWPWAVVLLVGVLLVVGLPRLQGGGRRHAADASAASPTWTRAVSALAIATVLAGAVGSTVMVIRIGHIGSKAAWTSVRNVQVR